MNLKRGILIALIALGVFASIRVAEAVGGSGARLVVLGFWVGGVLVIGVRDAVRWYRKGAQST